MAMSSGGMRFFAGLGITRVFDELGGAGGSTGSGIAFVINLLIAGVVCLFGVFARKGQKWAFIVGMVLYAADGLIFLLAGQMLSLAFHGLVLFFIFRGFRELS
jgi:hypothetical protein